MGCIDLFAEIKSRLSIESVLQYYGVQAKGKKVLCCFHREKSPSLTLYPNTNSFYCWGCGIGGSSIDFVQKLFDISPLEAAQKLNADFNLGIDGYIRPTKEQIQTAQKDMETLRNFENWTDNAYITLCEYFQLLQDFMNGYAPSNSNTPDSRFTEACHNMPYIEALIDILNIARIEKDFDMQIEFFKIYRKEVDSIAARITAYRKN